MQCPILVFYAFIELYGFQNYLNGSWKFHIIFKIWSNKNSDLPSNLILIDIFSTLRNMRIYRQYIFDWNLEWNILYLIKRYINLNCYRSLFITFTTCFSGSTKKKFCTFRTNLNSHGSEWHFQLTSSWNMQEHIGDGSNPNQGL